MSGDGVDASSRGAAHGRRPAVQQVFAGAWPVLEPVIVVGMAVGGRWGLWVVGGGGVGRQPMARCTNLGRSRNIGDPKWTPGATMSQLRSTPVSAPRTRRCRHRSRHRRQLRAPSESTIIIIIIMLRCINCNRTFGGVHRNRRGHRKRKFEGKFAVPVVGSAQFQGGQGRLFLWEKQAR